MPSKAVMRMCSRHTPAQEIYVSGPLDNPIYVSGTTLTTMKQALARARAEAMLLHREADQADVDADKWLRICLVRYSQSKHTHAGKMSWKHYAHLKCEADDLDMYTLMRKKDVGAINKFVTLEEHKQAEHDRMVEVNRAWKANGLPMPHHLKEIAALENDTNLPAVGYMVTYQNELIEYACYTVKDYERVKINGFGARVLDSMTSFARNEGHPEWDAKTHWVFDPRIMPWPRSELDVESPWLPPTVARTFAHFRAQGKQYPGWGKYAMDALEYAQLDQLLHTHVDCDKINYDPDVSVEQLEYCDKISNDPDVYTEHFWEAIEAERPKADGPFGMLRLCRHLANNYDYDVSITDCLIKYACEHADDFPVAIARANKPAVEPLFVLTLELMDDQATMYPLNARGLIHFPKPRPWSPTPNPNLIVSDDEHVLLDSDSD